MNNLTTIATFIFLHTTIHGLGWNGKVYGKNTIYLHGMKIDLEDDDILDFFNNGAKPMRIITFDKIVNNNLFYFGKDIGDVKVGLDNFESVLWDKMFKRSKLSKNAYKHVVNNSLLALKLLLLDKVVNGVKGGTVLTDEAVDLLTKYKNYILGEEVESNSKNDLIPANIPMANIEVKRDVYHTIVNTEIDFKIVTSGGEVKMDDYLSLSITSYRDAMEIAYNNKSLNRGKEYKISKQSSEFTDSSEFITYLITEVQTDTTKTIELSKPVCNIMVGYPSCGKSTYIAENLKGYTIIGFDSTLESLLNQEGNKTYDGLQYMYQGMTINEKKGISNITKLNFISALEEGENVVVDQTNLRSEDRLKWINIVQEIAPHYIINFIEFMTPINTCVTRKRHGKTIPLDVYERMHRMREDITDSEYFDTHLKIDNELTKSRKNEGAFSNE